MKDLICIILVIVIAMAIGGLIEREYLKGDLKIKDDLIDANKLTIKYRDKEISDLHERLSEVKLELEKLAAVDHKTPPDCKPGVWCAGCAFVKTYDIRISYGHGTVTKTYCGKNEACKHFTQAVIEE